MKIISTIIAEPGDHIHDVINAALDTARATANTVRVQHNDYELLVSPHHSFEVAMQNYRMMTK